MHSIMQCVAVVLKDMRYQATVVYVPRDFLDRDRPRHAIQWIECDPQFFEITILARLDDKI